MWRVYEVPFEYLEHLVTVPVTLNGVETSFVVDSGIGLTLVRDTLAGCEPTGATYTGTRMSGQEVSVPLGVAASVAFGGEERTDVEVGLMDMSGFPDALEHVGGFLSLAHFAETTLTVDYPRRVVSAGGAPRGTALAAKVRRDGPAVDMFVPFVLPDGRTVSLEVDMGSDALILDERFAELGGAEVRRVDGTDETGNAYTRRFTTLPGRIHPAGAPELHQDDPAVMFQQIVHDGLVGAGYLRRFAVTFDVAGEALFVEG
jgi:hypothetical protein